MKHKIHSRSAYLCAATIFFATLAAYLTIYSTSLYGPGLSVDSIGYIHLARDISQNGFTFLTKYGSVLKPPAYPIILAAVSNLMGTTVINAAAWINVMASAALVALILLSVLRVTTSFSTFAVIGVLSSCSIPLTRVWEMTWAEPLFILLVTLVILVASRTRHPASSVILAGLLTAAACLTRYPGVVLLPVVSVFFFLSQGGTIWKRCKYAIFYALLPTLLFMLYVVRNYVISGTLLGSRPPSETGFADNVDRATDVIFSWFLPPYFRSFDTWLLAVFAIIGAVAWQNREHIVRVVRSSDRIVFLCAAFFIAYTGFIVWAATTTAHDVISSRLLSPAYPSLLILFAVFMQPDAWHRQLVRLLLLGILCLALLWVTYTRVNIKADHGAGGFNTRSWQESAVINHFRQRGQPKDKIIFSNERHALYILADIVAAQSPVARNYHTGRATGVNEENLLAKYPSLAGALLVWFDRETRHLFTPDELKAVCHLEPVNTFSDGTIYRVECFNKRIENNE